MLSLIQPMLCDSSDKPFDSPEWLFEPKLDGVRCLAYVDNGQVRLMSRRGVDNTSEHSWLVEPLRGLDCSSAILDGELVALDPQGRPNFQLFQNRMTNHAPLYYYSFDLLWLNGQNTCGMT